MPQHTHNDQDHLGAWLVLSLLLVPLALYLGAVAGQHRKRRHWSIWRSLSFASGIGVIAVALAPPLSTAAHHHLQGHMAQHLLLGMFAPLGLALAAPVTLLLRTVPTATGRTVARLLGNRAMRLVSHPVTALLLNIGAMYVLYLTPLFRLILSHPALHALMNMHFLAAGYLYTWAIAGPDPAPGRAGMRTRVITLIVGIGTHASLAKLMYAHLHPAYLPIDAEQIRDAAVLMYYGGDLADVLLAIALFGSWRQAQRRRRRRWGGAALQVSPSS